MVASPVATLTTIGKNEIRKAVRIAGISQIPNQMIRNRVEADHHRVETAVDGARPADDDAEHDAECHRERETRERGPERDERVLEKRPPVLGGGDEDLRRGRQHERIDIEDAAHELPQHEHADREQPGRQLLYRRAHARRTSAIFARSS
jgi:hypothetical protein